MTHPGGRPLKFISNDELQKSIDEYFDNCDPHVEDVTEYVEARGTDGQLKKDKHGLNYLVKVSHKVKTKQIPYTVTGLANHLGTSRETLINYEKREEFFDTIKDAKGRVEEFWENQLLGSNATGPIFNLKNNYGWRDKTEVEADINVSEVAVSEDQLDQLIQARARRSNT